MIEDFVNITHKMFSLNSRTALLKVEIVSTLLKPRAAFRMDYKVKIGLGRLLAGEQSQALQRTVIRNTAWR